VITKTVTIGEQLVTLYSLDGRIWSSETRSLVEFRQRVTEMREILRETVELFL
jgi:hypothetical protein